jgi:hypothetical protein
VIVIFLKTVLCNKKWTACASELSETNRFYRNGVVENWIDGRIFFKHEFYGTTAIDWTTKRRTTQRRTTQRWML